MVYPGWEGGITSIGYNLCLIQKGHEVIVTLPEVVGGTKIALGDWKECDQKPNYRRKP